MTGNDTALGDFLRASRERTDPHRHGFSPSSSRRRVTGMRREEVAAAAGVSVDYYMRLEQSRESRPSLQVIDALAFVFDFDRDTREHVYRLAGLMPVIALGPSSDEPSTDLLELMHSWPHTPAVLFNRAYDILGHNHSGQALYSALDPERNLFLSVFLDPVARSFHRDWEEVARDSVGVLRLSLGEFPNDARLRDVVAVLERNSPEFPAIWADPAVRGKRMASKRLRHPLVGVLELTMQTFEVRSAPGQQLIVYHAAPGSRSDDGLRILGALAESTEGAES